MATKERHSNPVIGDTVRLRLDTYNGRAYADPSEFDRVEVYYLDPNARTPDNPEGRTLFATVTGGSVVREAEGKHYVDVAATKPQFVVGHYVDVWYVRYEADADLVTEESNFELYPPLWTASPIPIVYDFAFRFTPSRIVKGSKKALRIEIQPLVPRQSDIVRYYHNLIVVSDVSVTITQRCGECVPAEADLRVVVEDDPVDYREGCFAYYKLDTSEMDPGIYDVRFKLEFGDNVFYSDAQQLQIYT